MYNKRRLNLDDLLKKLLKFDPEKRISWEEFFNHNFFKQKNFDKVEKKDFEELLKKYPKLEETFELDTEVWHNEDWTIFGKVIKGTKILDGRGIYISIKIMEF